MKETRTRNTFRNIIWGILNKIILLFFPFIIRTILIIKLGSEYLGLNSLFTSILQVLNLTELGFSNAIVFSLYKPIVEKDTNMICALMNLYKKIYRIIGGIIFIIGISIIPFLTKMINGSYPNDINLYILYCIFLFNTVITYFLFAYKSALLTAHQRSDIISNVNTIVSVFQYILQIIVLCIFSNYYMFVIINTCSNIFNNVIILIITNKNYPKYKCRGKVNTEEIKNIKKRVTGLMIQKICGTTRNSLDSIFLSAFLGLNIVAIYTNYYTVMNSIVSILGIIALSMIASIGNCVITESIEKNYNNMNKFNFIYMWISGWCSVCLICLYQPFMKIWMGNDMLFPISTVILLTVYFYILKMGDILSSYTQATGLWYEGRYRALIETIFNILLNFLLGKFFGVNGIVLATIISLFLFNFCYGTSIMFKYYFIGLSMKKYFMRHLLYVLVTVFCCIVTYVLCDFIKFRGIVELISKAILCCVIPNCIYMFVYRRYDMYKESNYFVKNLKKYIL